MRQRKREKKEETSETLTMEVKEVEEQQREEEDNKKRFYACYLLVSLSPRHKGHTYIGFTVNPMRRIRQHNGEIGCGAWRTKKRRPWEMVLCIHGFPSNVSALQFEWAWQHPNESLAVRQSAAAFKSLSGVANKIKLAYTMLTLPSWQSLNMTVNYFSTKYTKHAAGCPSLPAHMRVRISPMDELPCYAVDGENEWAHDETWAEEPDRNNSSEDCSDEKNNGLDDKGQEERSASSNEETGLSMSRREQSQAKTTSSEEIEVIDVTTPSPLCGTSLLGKKRRVSSANAWPEIIDLTKSPGFVQLQ